MLFWILSAFLLTSLVLYLCKIYSRFSRHGVKNHIPVPFLGNSFRILFRLDHFAIAVEEYYNDFPEEKFVGKFDATTPAILIRDIELTKKILIKDFEHFLDHRVIVDDKADPIFGRNLFSMKGQTWKDMRSTLVPAFSSSKIRLMVPFMVDVGNQMMEALKNKIQASESGYIDIDVKDLTTRYANDVIASCAFGLKVDSLTDLQNEFYVKSKEVSSFKFKQLLIFFGFLTFPKVMNYFNVKFFSEEARHFFKSLVLNTMQDREERHIIRPDMIHLLMEAKKGQLSHEDKTAPDVGAGFATVEEHAVGTTEVTRVWTDNDLVAQAVLFLMAGFETVSSTMSFLFHELAVNPNVQEKLVQEIREYEAKNNGKFDYNSIQQMKYMDMVISEVLRLWPPAGSIHRLCVKDYNLGKPNDKATEDFIIRAGEGVSIPVWAFHRDPKYFPDPLKFDPERFSEQNKHNIKPFTYMPFGIGPRGCIASRFSLCELKVIVYQLLRNMALSPAAKTQIPAKLSPKTIILKIDGGHWVRFTVRNYT